MFRDGPAIHDRAPVVFICTGNYYRSRFAEALLNHYAEQRALPWRAISRGLALFLPQGAISPHVVEGLNRRGIDLSATTLGPTPLALADLERAELRIAMYEPEHRPMIRRMFPAWEDRVAYWQVPDLGEMEPEKGMAMMELAVLRLVEELGQGRPKERNPKSETSGQPINSNGEWLD